jgi:AcrR family transcriptional regulator
MSTLGPTLGISGTGLAKVCKRAGIPTPPHGYWAKLQHGKRVRRPALPPAPQGQSEQVEFETGALSRNLSVDQIPQDIAALVEAERAAEKPLTVAQRPTKFHAVVEKWWPHATRSFGSQTRNERQSKAEVRQRSTLSTFASEIGRLGGSVTCDERRRLTARIAGEDIEFSLSERSKQIRVPLTEQEARWGFYADRGYKTENEATGELRLRIENYFDQPIRRQWHDAPDKPLEQQLRDILIGFLFASALEREKRLEREEQQRRRLEEERRRYALAERRREVNTELQALRDEVAAWIEAAQIRAYVKACMGASGQGGADSLSPWARWAMVAADSIDPLIPDTDESVLLSTELPSPNHDTEPDE